MAALFDDNIRGEIAMTPNFGNRRSIRLKGYDYASAGAYFITVVTQERLCMFGEIDEGKMHWNDGGHVVMALWETLPARFPGMELDEFILMPNHFHGIFVFSGMDRAATRALDRAATRAAPTVGDVVGAFKSLTTVEYIRGVRSAAWRPFPGTLWQRDYYEHIIRTEASLNNLRQYIVDNPAQWPNDENNPAGSRTIP